MNPLRIYDYLTIARQNVFDGTRTLTEEQYTREFPIGLNSLARTLTHIMICEWAYIQRLERNELPPYEQWPIQDEHPPAFSVLEATWTKQATQTRDALGAVRDWDESITYEVPWAKPPARITASAGDLFTQLVLHEVHHRAQAINMLRQLGADVGEIDFNALMYARQPITTSP